LVDECHVAPADVYFHAVQKCPAEYRVGFSGTPLDRTDNRSLMAIAALGRVIYSVKPKVLIDAGYLAQPQIKMVQVRQKASVKIAPYGRFSQLAKISASLYKEHIVNSELRNDEVCRLASIAVKPCMVFVKEIQHGHTIKKLLEESGTSVEFVWGSTTPDRRRAAIESLERGDAEVMVASVVFQEGVDIPTLRSVIVASGGKSVIAALQRIGRGMRVVPGEKTSFDVYDVMDVGIPMFERHSRRRMNTYVREGYETIILGANGVMTKYAPKLLTRREKRDGAL